MARFAGFSVAGVPPRVMGIGPIAAIPKACKLAGITHDKIERIELNEAFAAQALAVIRTMGLDPSKINQTGGAIALGHPLGGHWRKTNSNTIARNEARQSEMGISVHVHWYGDGGSGNF